MADFRKWITAFAVLAMFAGLASAQIGNPGTGGGTPLQCQATVTAPPQLRSEGMTELIGDIVLTCTGGLASTIGVALPTVNVTISLATNVTSRLIGGTNLSEAILMIDEPGSGLPAVVPGSGPAAGQLLCAFGVGAVVGGCGPQYPINATLANGAQIQVMSSTPTAAFPITGAAAPVNMYLGTVAGTQVVFNGVPVLAPATTGAVRVYRITNIRANASGLTAGLPGTTPLNASIAISGNQSIPVSNSFVTAGYLQAGLSTGLRNAANTGGGNPNLNQCNTLNVAGGVGVLQYTENFATAFKTRVATTVNGIATPYNGQSGIPTLQSVPGQVQASESGFYFPLATATAIGGVTAATSSAVGVADYGTRLKAVFNNIPAGVRIFVSVTNLVNNTSNATTAAPAPAQNTSSYAVLVSGEAIADGNGSVPAVAPSTSVNGGATAIAELTVTGGSATATWEVINTSPAANETFNFGVYSAYTANPGANSPPPGTATVNQSYAPTPPVAFSAAAGSAASGTLTIPRFADTSTARNLLTIVICQTYLLFPFLTNASGSGFDTGLAIANTSTDPSTIGTAPQNGTCDMFFYGSSAPATLPVTTPNIPSGTVYTALVSGAAPGFSGYMIARCNFQWAHGFAFISDIGARNLAMGYLALVLNNGTISRGTAAESLGN